MEEFKFCPSCGAKMIKNAKFCPGCGKAQNSADTSQRQQEFAGKIVKCPNCGGVIDAFEAKCGDCGYEIRSIQAVGSIQELASKLEQIETQAHYEAQKQREKSNLITTFPVPNTKEDVLEFLLLCSSNIDAIQDSSNPVAKAWLTKFDYVYKKAEILFDKSKDLDVINKIKADVDEKKLRRKKKQRSLTWLKNLSTVIGLILIIVAIILDKTGNDTEVFQLFGGVVLIISASLLNKRKATLIECGATAVAGLITLGLSFLLTNGSVLLIMGGVVLIISITILIKTANKQNK